jgi:hypothetical protein
MDGILKRNSADTDGTMPYVLLDRWGVVKCYVSPAPDTVLESHLGKTVSLRGTSQRAADGVTHLSGATPATKSAAAKPVLRAAPPAPVAPPTPTVTIRQPASELQRTPEKAAAAAPRRQAVPEPRPQASQARNNTVRHTAQRANAPVGRRGPVRQAAFQEEIPRPVPQGRPLSAPASEPGTHGAAPQLYDEGPGVGPACGAGCADADCGDCGDCEGPDCGPLLPPAAYLSGLWIKADQLTWWTRGMNLPPLVTSVRAGTDLTQNAGHLPAGSNGTIILFGDERVDDEIRAGGRLQVGTWLNRCRSFGVEGEFFALENSATHFRLWSDGNPVISRPFFNVVDNEQQVERVAFPRGSSGSVDGSASVDTLSKFEGAGVRLLFNLCETEYCWQDRFDPCVVHHGCYRSQLIVGYRFLRLDDTLAVREELTATNLGDIIGNGTVEAPTGDAAFLIQDTFATKNQFHGAELGMLFELRRGRWSLDILPRIALGNTHETVYINGSTRTTSADGTQRTGTGGLLALSTNIGRYERDAFSVVPQIGATLGYQVSRHTRFTLGYSFLYWSRVARAGEQVDLRVNPNFLPEGDQTGAARPAFAFQETGFWAQGMNFGVDIRF